MPCRRFAPTLLLPLTLCAAVVAAPQAPPGQMGVEQLRPGMVAVGRTVFEGTRVEEFKAHILGVLENVIGTHRNLILARLEGGPLANTGVIAGMSGSPVYVDGRLIGAVSYALGAFSKEPIAGITPIAEMTDATALGGPRPPGARAEIELPLTHDRVVAALEKGLAWNRPFATGPRDARLAGASAVSGLGAGELGALLRPIATPLVMSGFEPSLSELFSSAFSSQGFIPTGAGVPTPRPGEMPFDGPLKPGDAVGVMLVSGDLEMGGTGTVTHVDGDRVYAFGHPLYNLGPTEFPMTRAYVYTVLPSLFSSFKLSTTNEIIGTFLQDRATAIAGRLGPGPRMMPVAVTLAQNRGATRTFHFNVVNDPLFAPLMTYAALLNTLSSYERQYGATTFTVQGQANVKGHGAIQFNDLFSTSQSATDASSYIVGPITYLLGNDLEKVEISSLDLTIATSEEVRTATLERAWVDDPRPRAGRTVPLKVLIRTFRGEEEVRTLPVEIPANATGAVSLIVTDGARLGQQEQRETRAPQQVRTVDQAIKALNSGRRRSVLYVRLVGRDPGAVVNGELLSSLPPSVLGVLEADRHSGAFSPVRGATLAEWELPTDRAVSGSRTLSLTVSPN
ncbi:MAG: SpoIVB peptidase S55 domain-containing protein [Acidobacteriota bacterium]